MMNIVLTGSSSGIGLALASHLLQRGDRVWGLARSDQTPTKEKWPENFTPIATDVSSWEDQLKASQEVAASTDSIDALITCAGIQGEVGSALKSDPVRWSKTVRANLDGTFYSIRAFSTLLRNAKRRAKVVCFSGGGSTKARANFSAYGSAKTAVLRLVETIADEEGASWLDINAIAPGAINTRLTDEVISLGPTIVGQQEFESALKQKANGGASLEKAIATIEWMISRESDRVSGRLISAPWDPIEKIVPLLTAENAGDIYKLRRVTPT